MKFTAKLLASGLLGVIMWGAPGVAAHVKINEMRTDTCGIFYLKTYPRFPEHKAVATTNGEKPSNHGACGFSQNWPSKPSAISEALRTCRKQRVRGILETRCKIFEVK